MCIQGVSGDRVLKGLPYAQKKMNIQNMTCCTEKNYIILRRQFHNCPALAMPWSFGKKDFYIV